MMKSIRILITGVLCTVVSSLALGQTLNDLSTSPAVPPGRVPLPLLYRHFLAYQNHLDRAGTALDKQGKNGAGLHNHFQQKLGFSDDQFGAVRQTALRLEAELQQQDVKAKAVIEATRAKFPRTVESPADLPPVPPELVQLQQERDSLIGKEVSGLKAALGSSAAAELDTFLQHDFAPTVTVQSVGASRLHDPVQYPVSGFPPETQP